MSLDIVLYYADLGRPYFSLIERMTKTAKLHMPHCRTVLLTPDYDAEIADLFDVTYRMQNRATKYNLMLERARATVSWAAQTSTPCAFVDADLEFVSPIPDPKLWPWDVALMWRGIDKPDQPINAGLVLAKPHHAKLWDRYGSIVVNLPQVIHGWWCEQIAWAILIGSNHEPGDTLTIDEANITLLDSCHACDTEDKLDQGWAIHHKGSRKGDAWKPYYKYHESDYHVAR